MSGKLIVIRKPPLRVGSPLMMETPCLLPAPSLRVGGFVPFTVTGISEKGLGMKHAAGATCEKFYTFDLP